MEVPKSGKMVFAKPVYHMLCYQSDKVVKSSVEKTENTQTIFILVIFSIIQHHPDRDIKLHDCIAAFFYEMSVPLMYTKEMAEQELYEMFLFI